MSERHNTHLQQPTDWNTTHSDTTMSTAPAYATLLNSTSSSEEESSNPRKPPSNQTVVGSTMDHEVSNILLRLTPPWKQPTKTRHSRMT